MLFRADILNTHHHHHHSDCLPTHRPDFKLSSTVGLEEHCLGSKWAPSPLNDIAVQLDEKILGDVENILEIWLELLVKRMPPHSPVPIQ